MPTIKNVQVILENKQLEVPMGTTLKELLSHRDHSLPPAVAAVVNNVLHLLPCHHQLAGLYPRMGQPHL